jgi:WD40 repeat protein
VREIAIGPKAGEEVFASVSGKGDAKLWSVRKGGELQTFMPTDAGFQAIALSSDGKHLILGGQRAVTIWLTDSGRLIRKLEATAKVTCVAVSADGKTLAAGTAEGTVLVWNLASGKLLGMVKEGSGTVVALRFAPRGSYLAAIDGRGVRLWDVKDNGKDFVETARFGSPLPPLDASFSADGKALAIGFGHSKGMGLVRVWDVEKLLAD